MRRPKGMSIKEAVDWYLSRARKVGECLEVDCGMWKGYPAVSINAEQDCLGRFVLEVYGGMSRVEAAAQGLVMRHRPLVCHNTKCVNPEHLEWGSLSRNARDVKLDGVFYDNNKLSYEDIELAWGLRETGVPIKDIAERLEVQRNALYKVFRGERSGWVSRDMGFSPKSRWGLCKMRGVNKHKSGGYAANMSENGKQYHLGYFALEEDAEAMRLNCEKFVIDGGTVKAFKEAA